MKIDDNGWTKKSSKLEPKTAARNEMIKTIRGFTDNQLQEFYQRLYYYNRQSLFPKITEPDLNELDDFDRRLSAQYNYILMENAKAKSASIKSLSLG